MDWDLFENASSLTMHADWNWDAEKAEKAVVTR
jgi:hypothetical protein